MSCIIKAIADVRYLSFEKDRTASCISIPPAEEVPAGGRLITAPTAGCGQAGRETRPLRVRRHGARGPSRHAKATHRSPLRVRMSCSGGVRIGGTSGRPSPTGFACHCEDHKERSDVVGRGNPFRMAAGASPRPTNIIGSASRRAVNNRPYGGVWTSGRDGFSSN